MAFKFKALNSTNFGNPKEGNQNITITKVDYDAEFFTEQQQMVKIIFKTENGISFSENFNAAHEVGMKMLTRVIATAHAVDVRDGQDIGELIDTAEGAVLNADIKVIEAIDKKTKELIKTKSGEQIYNIRLNNLTNVSTPEIVVYEEELDEAVEEQEADDEGFDFF